LLRAGGFSAALFALGAAALSQTPLRPPAVPLVTRDPYLSIWSEADHPTDDITRHWTHAPNSIQISMDIDGSFYWLLGGKFGSMADSFDVARSLGVRLEEPALPETGLDITPSNTTYHYANDKVKVDLSFLTPAIPSDLNVMSRPVTYVTCTVRSADGQAHHIKLGQLVSSFISTSTRGKGPVASIEKEDGVVALKASANPQTLLKPMGDDVRINWGYEYVGLSPKLLHGISESTTDANNIDLVTKLGFTVGNIPISQTQMIAYDEGYNIYYFGQNLRPYWKRNGESATKMLAEAANDFPKLQRECAAFDKELMADAAKVGGTRYSQIIALAYRECLAACGLAADSNGQPLFFTKENTSNGDIATVDVIFPMDPIWVLLSPTLAKASLVSNFDYAASPHWKFPNAPHDLGTYPRVFGRDDGGEEMAVEESGNMIILTDAIAKDDGNADFAKKWWPQLTQWAKYLEQYGLDPADQLCTDDFMGHLAHNANLSVKAIVALAAYGDLCRIQGDTATADRYMSMAKADAQHWVQVADAGDHSLLAFDKPGTWSQKYNLVWDKILGLNVFPPEVAAKEVAYYKTVMLRYGVPLDSRTHLTKTDWSIWSATMATDKSDFETIVSPIWDYINGTTTRDPIADSYETDKIESGGMHARPVVGGFFIRMLTDPEIWHKWSSRDKFHAGNWAPLPVMPTPENVVPSGRDADVQWHYTLEKPADGWTAASFDDSSWKTGPAPFGSDGTPSINPKTQWTSDDIWIRRSVTLPSGKLDNLHLLIYHDEDIVVYINGVLAASEPGYDNSYAVEDISPDALAQLKPGATITIAAHCHQTTGGQGIDVGIVRLKASK